ncbi:hypothetical protein MRB53_017606 [Persea americana]|uniref:Uncharacterized protein n=1 Tax=Persea americana TaxID=3435 RepID=A0ACC2M5I5_PERAE|nr:hypothetical protein MRB53_017606 [Persea americana]
MGDLAADEDEYHVEKEEAVYFHPPISEDSKQKNIKFHRKSIFPIYLQRFSSIHLLRRRNVLPIHQITVLRLIICPISIQRGFVLL